MSLFFYKDKLLLFSEENLTISYKTRHVSNVFLVYSLVHPFICFKKLDSQWLLVHRWYVSSEIYTVRWIRGVVESQKSTSLSSGLSNSMNWLPCVDQSPSQFSISPDRLYLIGNVCDGVGNTVLRLTPLLLLGSTRVVRTGPLPSKFSEYFPFSSPLIFSRSFRRLRVPKSPVETHLLCFMSLSERWFSLIVSLLFLRQ